MFRLLLAICALLAQVSAATVATRQVLTAPQALYFSMAPVGDDANDCLTTLTPCETLQRIADIAYGQLDLAGFDVNAQVVGSNQVFAQSVSIQGAQVGIGAITFIGNPSNPADVVIGVPGPNDATIKIANSAVLAVNGFQIQAGPSSNSISVSNHATLNLSNFIMNVGVLSFDVSFFGILNTNGTCKIIPGGNAFAHIHDSGYLNMANNLCDVIGSWGYPSGGFFLGCSENAIVRMATMTFNVIGPVTGRKSTIHQGCSVGAPLSYGRGNAGADAFFPGTAASSAVSPTGIFNDMWGTTPP